MALDFPAGCFGGGVGVVVGHPFDTVKIRLQTAPLHKYRGTFHCAYDIAAKESVFGFYKGLKSPLFGLAFINAIVFGVQSNVQRILPNPNSITSHCVAGAIGGFAQSFICSPMELAKTRMQKQGEGQSRQVYKVVKQRYQGPVDCLVKIYKTNGLHRGVFRGLGITFIRETPSFAVYFGSFEYICRCFTPENERYGMATMLFAGGIAGMLTWLSTYPTDVIKTRFQADVYNEYTNLMDCIKKTYKVGGYGIFFEGLGVTMLRAFPTNAATLTSVTILMRYIHEDEIQ